MRNTSRHAKPSGIQLLLLRKTQLLFRPNAISQFSPASLGSKLAIWLDSQDASTFTFNSGNVASVANKGTLGGLASQSTGANQPLYNTTAINSKPGFGGATGSTRFLTSTWAANPSYYECYLVVKRLTGGDTSQTFMASNVSGGLQLRYSLTLRQEMLVAGVVSIGTATTTTSLDTAYILYSSYDGLNYAFGLNGVADGSGINPQIFTAQTFRFLNNSSSSQRLNGWIGEVIYCTTALASGERTSVLGYLQLKWGL